MSAADTKPKPSTSGRTGDTRLNAVAGHQLSAIALQATAIVLDANVVQPVAHCRQRNLDIVAFCVPDSVVNEVGDDLADPPPITLYDRRRIRIDGKVEPDRYRLCLDLKQKEQFLQQQPEVEMRCRRGPPIGIYTMLEQQIIEQGNQSLTRDAYAIRVAPAFGR
nr:hypothetical protein [Sphingomonas elodea]